MKTKNPWIHPIAIICLLLTFTFGCDKEDPVELPKINTSSVTEITTNTAKSGGNITDDGGASVTSRGVVWSTLENPEIDDKEGITEDGSGLGEFTSEMENLQPATTYYIRAYATNIKGTAYGEQKSFKTERETGTFVDQRDGQEYEWVRIGDQVWMAENLKYLPEVSPGSAGSETNPHYSVYGYEGTDVSEAVATDNYNNYGVLYNWPAAMDGASSSSANPSGVQGVCPAGWHLPSDAEWTELTDYVVSQGYPNVGYKPNGAGNALKSCRQVDSPLGGECATSEHPRWNSGGTYYGTDQFGFSALPGGQRCSLGGFDFIGRYGHWWSSTESYTDAAWVRAMYSNTGDVPRGGYVKEHSLSVRCLRDD